MSTKKDFDLLRDRSVIFNHLISENIRQMNKLLRNKIVKISPDNKQKQCEEYIGVDLKFLSTVGSGHCNLEFTNKETGISTVISTVYIETLIFKD